MRQGFEWPGGDLLATAWGLPMVEVHNVLDSTQDRALTLAREGAAPWTAVVAHEQTVGRGRRGRPWRSGRGLGLWVSLVMPTGIDGPDDSLSVPLTLRLGVGVADAVAATMREASVKLKWPNDVWLNDRKVAGILAERVGAHTIAGIGLNVLHDAPDFEELMRDRATSLRLEGWRGEVVPLGEAIIKQLRAAVDQPASEVLKALRERDALRDREVVCPDGRTAHGAGFDDDGALIVRAGEDKWRITAGTLHLRPATETAEG